MGFQKLQSVSRSCARHRGCLATAGILSGFLIWRYCLRETFESGPCLSRESFSAWRLESVTWVSQTSAVLALTCPSFQKHDRAKVEGEPWMGIWRKGLWAVQVKQPQLQIQREYSPLPHLPPSQAPTVKDGNGSELRLFIRYIPSGEVSPYLLKLRAESSTIDLRGPVLHWEFPSPAEDVRLLFLAGGTGISPALQAAAAILSSNPSNRMKILWANRSRNEAAIPDVEHWVEYFQGRLQVEQYYDDREGSIKKRQLKLAIQNMDHLPPNSGRNIILVSGPDGFVSYIAGSKVWVDGREAQGPLGGLLAEVLSESDTRAMFSSIVKL